MSGKDDPRSVRTREAVIGAFSELVLARRYDEIRVEDIVADAGVGRSTFYDHYRDKDDVLVHSMSGLLEVLASAAEPLPDLARLERVLQHFWQNRDLVRGL